MDRLERLAQAAHCDRTQGSRMHDFDQGTNSHDHIAERRSRDQTPLDARVHLEQVTLITTPSE